MMQKGRWFAVLGVVTLILVASVTEGRADTCRRVVSVQSAPIVTQSYVAPVYSHGYVQQQVLVPQVQALAVNPDFYFSVGDEYRQLAFARLVAQEYAKMVQSQPQPQQYPLGPSPAPIVAAPKKEALIVQPTDPPAVAGAGAECKPVSTGLPKGFREVVEAKCASCHASGKGKQYLDLSNLESLFSLPLATRDRMYRSVSNERMPKNKDAKLTDDELKLFNQYAGLAESAVFGGGPAMPEAKK